MPTRIQLREPHPSSSVTTPPISPTGASNAAGAESRVGIPSEARSVHVSFTSEKSSSPSSDPNAEEEFNVRDEFVHISSTDIVASPRLVGYLCCFTSSMVLMISSILFWDRYVIEEGEADDLLKGSRYGDFADDGRFFMTSTHSILKYKMYCAIAWGAAGILYNIVILIVHFDKRCLPSVWSYIFKDGSKGERNLLFFLLFFWVVGVHMCTSAYSVGSEQINVYFSSWGCLCTTLATYEMWRESSEKTTIYDKLTLNPSRTTIKWAAGLFFSALTFFSIVDIWVEYVIYEVPSENSLFDAEDVPTSDWIKGLATSGSVLIICLLLFILNVKMLKPFGSKYRYFELFSILSSVGVSAYMVFDYTGIGGYINTPANPYFGIWGMCLSSMLMIGDWLEENKSLGQMTAEFISDAVSSPSPLESEQQQPTEEKKDSSQSQS